MEGRLRQSEQAASVCNVPALKRNTAITAARASAKAQELTLASSGASERKAVALHAQVARNTVWITKPDRKIEDHAHDSRR